MRAPTAIAIGCSAGGVDALKAVIGGLHEKLPQTVVVCCHSSSDTIDLLCEVLGRTAKLPVVEAVERERAQPGIVQLAPTGYHLMLEADQCFSLSIDARVNHSRPSIDVLFMSAADVWRHALIGVILTGGNNDGAAGLRRIRQLGGVAIIQSPQDAVAAAMPQAALDLAGADHCLPLEGIAPLLNRLCMP
jgi:two-component system, chemotaxis family, protein-glutamate methylesterase/glutaminase